MSLKFHSILASPEAPERLWAISLVKNRDFFDEGSHVMPKGASGAIRNRFWGDFGRILEIPESILGGFGRDLGTFAFILKEI